MRHRLPSTRLLHRICHLQLLGVKQQLQVGCRLCVGYICVTCTAAAFDVCTQGALKRMLRISWHDTICVSATATPGMGSAQLRVVIVLVYNCCPAWGSGATASYSARRPRGVQVEKRRVTRVADFGLNLESHLGTTTSPGSLPAPFQVLQHPNNRLITTYARPRRVVWTCQPPSMCRCI
jgi:hypothetical protein